MAQLEIRNLTFKYPGAGKPVLDNLSLSVRAGEFAVLTGRTGSGKTTLLKIIKKISPPTASFPARFYTPGYRIAKLTDECRPGKSATSFRTRKTRSLATMFGASLPSGWKISAFPMI